MTNAAYQAAIKMLARRELSEAQIRLRLIRKGYEADEIDAAVERLKTAGSLDDARVAGVIGRTQAHVRRRGKLRVRRQIEAAGIDGAIARRVTDDIFAEIDPDALLAAALERQLRGRAAIDDDREFQRLYRRLVAQGFDHDQVLVALRARRHKA